MQFGAAKKTKKKCKQATKREIQRGRERERDGEREMSKNANDLKWKWRQRQNLKPNRASDIKIIRKSCAMAKTES